MAVAATAAAQATPMNDLELIMLVSFVDHGLQSTGKRAISFSSASVLPASAPALARMVNQGMSDALARALPKCMA